MKRADLERHLRTHGCGVLRDRGKHTIWLNPLSGGRSPVARQNEIPSTTARNICLLLGIPPAA
jgi:mRNA interferase HicA